MEQPQYIQAAADGEHFQFQACGVGRHGTECMEYRGSSLKNTPIRGRRRLGLFFFL